MNKLIGLLMGAGAILADVSFAMAQLPKTLPRIGYLALLENPDFDAAFRKGMQEQGYIEEQNIHFEYRYAGGKVERLTELAADLVAAKIDVIVASSTLGSKLPSRRRRRLQSSFRLPPIQLHPDLLPAWHDPVEISRV